MGGDVFVFSKKKDDLVFFSWGGLEGIFDVFVFQAAPYYE